MNRFHWHKAKFLFALQTSEGGISILSRLRFMIRDCFSPLFPSFAMTIFYSSHCEILEKGIEAISYFPGMVVNRFGNNISNIPLNPPSKGERELKIIQGRDESRPYIQNLRRDAICCPIFNSPFEGGLRGMSKT
jgi:hypothetical protein